MHTHCHNRQLCLRYLRGIGNHDPTPVLFWIHDDFWRDASFLLDALKCEVVYNYDLFRKFQHDAINFDVFLAVFTQLASRTRKFNHKFDDICTVYKNLNWDSMLPMFADGVKRKLTDHSSFITFILGMEVDPQQVSSGALRPALPMLCQDEETTRAPMKSVAAYIGIPKEEELRFLEDAWSFTELRPYAVQHAE